MFLRCGLYITVAGIIILRCCSVNFCSDACLGCTADIAMLGSSIIVFKNCADVSFCVVGEEDGVSYFHPILLLLRTRPSHTYTARYNHPLFVYQNELIYSCVLDGLLRAVSGLLRFHSSVRYARTRVEFMSTSARIYV